jgi:choline transport protein
MTVNYPDYDPTNWQGTLFVFATVLIVWIINTGLTGVVPKLQNALMFVHVFAFLAIIIVLWMKAPLNSSSDVFLKFTNEGGWSSTGLSLVIGQITAIYALVCMYIQGPSRTE